MAEPLFDVVLIDLSIIHRTAWHASADEVSSRALTETVRTVHEWAEQGRHVAVCVDMPPYRRAKLLPEYKAQRQAAPPELHAQLARIKERLTADGFALLGAEGYEADDILATCVAKLRGKSILVVTGDKDALQLVGGGVLWVSPARPALVLDQAGVLDEWGVGPALIASLLALAGDDSDNIPGVPGVGAKTAAKWLTQYGTLEAVLAATAEMTPAKRAAVEAARDDVRRYLTLTQLEDDAPIDVESIFQTPRSNTMADTQAQQPATPPTAEPPKPNGNGHAIAARYDFKRAVARPKPPARIIVYGEAGIGKTTFGTEAPSAVLIPTEDGALAVSTVQRVPVDGKCRDWADLIEAVKTIATIEHDFKNVVLDTLNGAYSLCAEMVCKRDFGGVWSSAKDTEGFNAFGKGDDTTSKEFRALLDWLDICQQRRGMGVILLAHVGLQKQGNALGQDFQKFTADVGKKTWALVCAWADQVAHACREFRAATIDKEKKAKASAIGSERWLVFDGGPARDAKSRVGYEMPERILLSYDDYDRWMRADRVGLLVTQAVELLGKAAADHVRIVQDRCGGAISPDTLRAMGAPKLTKMIGWLMANQVTTTQPQTQQEAR